MSSKAIFHKRMTLREKNKHHLYWINKNIILQFFWKSIDEMDEFYDEF